MKDMNKNSNKLRTMPVGKLLFTMSIPAMFSMLIQALYNIVDSIYVSKISPSALNAVSLAFPMQMLLIAFSLGVGIGTSSLISRRLGERKHEDANQAAKHGLLLAILFVFVFVLVGLFLSRPFLTLMTKDTEVINLGTSYLRICFVLGFGVLMEITLSKILQGSGNMIVPMISQLLGAITNIILDPIFIFNLGLGVRGAAIATVIGQIFSFIFVLTIFLVKKQEVSISLGHLKLSKRMFLDILEVGLPVTIMNSIASVTTTLLNTILSASYLDPELGKAAVNVLGVYFKLQSFVFMPIFGLTQGAFPILGYNFGANQPKRFMKAIALTFITGLIIILCGFIAFQVFPGELLSLFSPNQPMKEIGLIALPRISLNFIPAITVIIASTVFQSMGHGIKSLLMTLMRQIIILIPTAYLLSTFNPDWTWFAYGIAETITTLVFIPITVITVKNAFAKKIINFEELATA